MSEEKFFLKPEISPHGIQDRVLFYLYRLDDKKKTYGKMPLAGFYYTAGEGTIQELAYQFRRLADHLERGFNGSMLSRV